MIKKLNDVFVQIIHIIVYFGIKIYIVVENVYFEMTVNQHFTLNYWKIYYAENSNQNDRTEKKKVCSCK